MGSGCLQTHVPSAREATVSMEETGWGLSFCRPCPGLALLPPATESSLSSFSPPARPGLCSASAVGLPGDLKNGSWGVNPPCPHTGLGTVYTPTSPKVLSSALEMRTQAHRGEVTPPGSWSPKTQPTCPTFSGSSCC